MGEGTHDADVVRRQIDTPALAHIKTDYSMLKVHRSYGRSLPAASVSTQVHCFYTVAITFQLCYDFCITRVSCAHKPRVMSFCEILVSLNALFVQLYNVD